MRFSKTWATEKIGTLEASGTGPLREQIEIEDRIQYPKSNGAPSQGMESLQSLQRIIANEYLSHPLFRSHTLPLTTSHDCLETTGKCEYLRTCNISCGSNAGC